VTCFPAPTCLGALDEATKLWPWRLRVSDGVCASYAHIQANPGSDHSWGNAFDLTHDPGRGCDAHHQADQIKARNDSRVKYVISNGRIWEPSVSSEWRTYKGPNPHLTHMHVSIQGWARLDMRSWYKATPTQPPGPPLPPAPVPNEGDNMPAICIPSWGQRDPVTSRAPYYKLGWLQNGDPIVLSFNGAPLLRVDGQLFGLPYIRSANQLAPAEDVDEIRSTGAIVIVCADGGLIDVAKRP
jgi:hypothetical protein